MYSSKDSINILTALLVKHGIKHAVVCPGSRNAPIVHNLNECPDISCVAVTDERSAGFYALGMAQALDEPIAVCVTSGSAVLNVAPAVAEAHYQHQSLVVISADRPAAWIDQIDGQTLRQPGALEPWVACSVSLPEPQTASAKAYAEARWHCNRLVNEALIEATADHRPCVHINVPLSEPLFSFDVAKLPDERAIVRFAPSTDYDCLRTDFVDDILQAKRPMIVFGQMSPWRFLPGSADYLFSHVIVLHEALAPFPSISHFDEVLATAGRQLPAAPDVVLYVGDGIVSKRLKAYLRQNARTRVWRISSTGRVEDTFQNLRGIVVGDAEQVLSALDHKMGRRQLHGMDYRRKWLHLLGAAREHAQSYEPAYSQMAVVRAFEQLIDAQGLDGVAVHYANSSPIRLANIYARHHVWCNRGVNGIEGSLSTACGFAVAARAEGSSPDGAAGVSATASARRVYCVIGDLSFFYDQNALWHADLPASLRILLLNNGRGGIFNMVMGLGGTAACSQQVMGAHSATAQGVCQQNGIGYRQVSADADLSAALNWLTTTESTQPLLLEVVTDADTDAAVFKNYYAYM